MFRRMLVLLAWGALGVSAFTLASADEKPAGAVGLGQFFFLVEIRSGM
jgi:hypothetical protein